MNIVTTRDFRDAIAADGAGEEAKMEQIRELLHGELKRQQEARMAALEHRVRELEGGVYHRLDALQARLDALTSEMTMERRSHFDELARSILDLGERVRRLSRD
jgi:polyhydroxyalkanoate synthesis regulator phasin